jgi:hypothetical protein
VSADRPPKLLMPASMEERIAGCSMARSGLDVATGYESAGSMSGVGEAAVAVVSGLPRGMEDSRCWGKTNIKKYVCTLAKASSG